VNSFLLALIGGAVGWLVLGLSVLTGLRIIKVKAKVHKLIGLSLFGLATLHGIGGILLYLGLLPF
jgi:hypothetical protein